ncbi:hypothetical protein [Methylobacterium radiotolerans]
MIQFTVHTIDLCSGASKVALADVEQALGFVPRALDFGRSDRREGCS